MSDELSARDRIIDDLLVESSRETHTADSPCVDPELLAAWGEHTLAEADAAQVELHLSSCAHCQAMLAAFARSDPGAAASPKVGAPANVVQIDQRRRDTTARWPNRRWLLTSGAGIAAALVVWFAVAGRNPVLAPARETTAPTQVARADRAASGAGASAAGLPSAASRLAAPAESARSAPQGAASKEAPALAKQVESRTSTDERRQAGPTAPQTLGRPSDANAMMDAVSPGNTNRALPAAAAPPPPPPPAVMRAENARGEGLLQSRDRAFAADPRVLIESADGTVQWRIRADNRLERAYVPQAQRRGNPSAVASPGASGQGRGGQGGRGQGGISQPLGEVVVAPAPASAFAWEVLELPVGVVLTAGSAPASDVCWLVGRGGAIFIANATGQLRRISSPDTSDLVGVTATSARSAAITTSTGLIFTTDDGGTTWR